MYTIHMTLYVDDLPTKELTLADMGVSWLGLDTHYQTTFDPAYGVACVKPGPKLFTSKREAYEYIEQRLRNDSRCFVRDVDTTQASEV